jgi:hypothetical protein
MARKRNPRVVALEMLASLKRNADSVRSRWTAMSRGTVYAHSTEVRMMPKFYGRPVSDTNPLVPTNYSNSTTRPRRLEEYPEAQASEWSAMWAWADDMEKQAAELKALALEQWKQFPGNDGYTLTRKETGQ